jgi:hypothetical protein
MPRKAQSHGASQSTDGEDRWQGKFWHYKVHERLGESLYYYFVQVRPFNETAIKNDLNQILSNRRVGSFRVFGVFGAYDLLIRIWLHPTVATRFADWLEELHGCRDIGAFVVTHVHRRWYPETRDTDEVKSLLEQLTKERIKAVQDDRDPQLLKRLRKAELILDLPSRAHRIKFFVPIRLSETAPGILSRVVRELKEHIGNSKFASLYGGYGFCPLLLSSSTEDRHFGSISSLPTWVSEHFSDFGASTETYLAGGNGRLLGEERILEGTFRGIRGHDLFVQSIIPELYELHEQKIEAIEPFVRTHIVAEPLSKQDRDLLHDLLLAILRDDAGNMSKTLFIFFSDLENHLRKTLEPFVRLYSSKPMSQLAEEAHIPKEKGKHIALGDMLTLHMLAIKHGPTAVPLPELRPQQLASLRNAVAHGEDPLEMWENSLQSLVRNLPGLRALLRIIEQTTSIELISEYH